MTISRIARIVLTEAVASLGHERSIQERVDKIEKVLEREGLSIVPTDPGRHVILELIERIGLSSVAYETTALPLS